MHRRNPLPQRDIDKKKETISNIQQVDARNTRNGIEVSEAGTALNLAMKKVDDIVMIIQNPDTSADQVRKAAEEALAHEANEDFPRESLASAARNSTEAQSALAMIRDQGPTVIAGFKEIEKNSRDRNKVIESLKQIMLARLQVVAANHALIGGVQGGDRQLSLVSQISPSQQAIGRRLDNNQRKTVEEAQKNLAAQTKKVDEAVAVIQKQGSSPQQIEAAAKEALFHESEEDFAREVLASAANDAKAAMEALAIVRDHGPTEVIAGFKAIAGDSKNANAVKKSIELIIRGREKVVPASFKLIELSGGSASSIGSNTSAGSTSSAPISVIQTGPTGLISTGSTRSAEDKRLLSAPPASADTSRERKDENRSTEDGRRLDSVSKVDNSNNVIVKTAGTSDENLEATRRLLTRVSGPTPTETSVVLVGSASNRVNT
ncbi:hypothetical protein PCANC_12799 [Puccinia coronata f. sp. avenae]|uniref:Uncharacterized protein n=1 Tax=Puccinia coronata f. sp. avenae TaxID=200324 RepID=A0A2N5T4I4_9BASI|nr:hypothetical protein PCANC_12799 [Puccinia coronata f. sp. avenae]